MSTEPEKPEPQSHAEATFGQPTFSWSLYERFRPAYPPALYFIVFEYHRAGWGTAVDFGCGPGTTFAALLSKFDKVVGVDVNAPQLAAITERFADEVLGGRVELTRGRAEDVCEAMGEGTVDMVVCAEAIHWFDIDRWLTGVARILKKGGTVAVWQYGYEELSNTEANTLWQSFLQRTLARPRPGYAAPSSARPAPNAPADESNGGGKAIMTSLLLSMGVPPSLYARETRYRFLTPFFSASPSAEWTPRSTSTDRLGPPYMLSAQRTVDDMAQSLLTLGNLVELERAYDGGKDMQETLDGLRRIFGEDGTFEVRWPVGIVLAERI